MNFEKITKGELIERYCHREPKVFIQYDGFANKGDCYSDVEGDGLFMGVTSELMYGSSVRVLIEPGTTKADAMRLLKNMRRWIKSETNETIGMEYVKLNQPNQIYEGDTIIF